MIGKVLNIQFYSPLKFLHVLTGKCHEISRNSYSLLFKIPILIFIYLLIPKESFSGTIKGYVFDLETGTPLVNATVHLEKTN